MSGWDFLIGGVGDLVICLLSWRFILKPSLEKYVRRIARDEVVIARKFGSPPAFLDNSAGVCDAVKAAQRSGRLQ